MRQWPRKRMKNMNGYERVQPAAIPFVRIVAKRYVNALY